MRIRHGVTLMAVALAAVFLPVALEPAHAALPTSIPIVPIMADPPFDVRVISNDGQWLLGGSDGTNTYLINWITNQNFSVSGHAYAMSTDGRFVVTITGTTLSPADTVPFSFDVYRFDRLTSTYTYVAPSPVGYFLNDALISDDGTVIAYTTPQSMPNPSSNIWITTVGGTPAKLATSGTGLTAYPVNEIQDLTPDGRYLVYRTSCKYPSCPAVGAGEIRRYDRTTHATLKVSVSNTGVESNGGDAVASVSPSGRYITFQSNGTNLGANPGPQGGWFVRDTVGAKTTYLGGADGIFGPGFTSDAGVSVYPNLASTTGGGYAQTFLVRDLATGQTINVVSDSHGVPFTSNTSLNAVSANGAHAVFRTDAPIVPNAPFGNSQYLAELAGPPTLPPSNQRLLDTRYAIGIGTNTPIPANQEVAVQVVGRAGVMADATGVFVNLAIIKPVAGGYAKIYPCDQDPGLVSSINYAANENSTNFTMVKVSATGTICVKASVATHMLVDLQQVVTAFTPIAPVRPLDTRLPVDSPTPLTPGEVRSLHITGSNGVIDGAEGVALNVTVVSPDANGYLTAFPCGTPTATSSSNFTAGRTKASFVVVRPNVDGDICFTINANANLVVDLIGHLPVDSAYTPSAGVRLVQQADGVVRGGHILKVVANGGNPGLGSQAMLGVVAVRPATGGYITVFQCGSQIPVVSGLNFVAGLVTSNVMLAPLDFGGNTCLYVSEDVRLVVDLYGSLA